MFTLLFRNAIADNYDRNAQTVRRREQLADKHRERAMAPPRTVPDKPPPRRDTKREPEPTVPSKAAYSGLASMIGKKRRQQKVKKGGK